MSDRDRCRIGTGLDSGLISDQSRCGADVLTWWLDVSFDGPEPGDSALGNDALGELEHPIEADCSQQFPIVGHHHEGAAVGVECRLQLFDRIEVEVIGGFVENEQVGTVGHQHRERCPGAFAWRQRPARSIEVVGSEPELGKERAGVGDLHRRDVAESDEQSGVADERSAGLLDLADDHVGPERTPARRGFAPTEEEFEQRRLSTAVGSDDRDAVTEPDGEVDRSEAEVTTVDDRLARRDDDVSTAPGGRDLVAQLPLPAWLVDDVETLQGRLGACSSTRELLGLVQLVMADELVVLTRAACSTRTPCRPFPLPLATIDERLRFAAYSS